MTLLFGGGVNSNMKRATCLCRLGVSLLFFFFVFIRLSYSEEEKWYRAQAEHFEVFQKAEDSELTQRIFRDAEAHLDRILKRLGYSAPRSKWTDDDRVKVFMFEDQPAYQERRGAPSWAAGDADYRTRTITAYVGSDRFFESTLPHEIAHLVLFELTAEYQNVPKWLHEGFALSQEEGKRTELDRAARRAAAKGNLLPLAMLTIIEPKEQSHGGANTYYAESQAFVSYLMDQHGADRFRNLILNLAEGKSFEDAMGRAYRGVYDDLSELEAEFFKSLS